MEWEEKFDEFVKEKNISIEMDGLVSPIKEMKSFIKLALESQMSDLRKEVEKVLERHAQWKPTEGYDSEEEKGFQKGLMAEAKLIRDEVLLLMKK